MVAALTAALAFTGPAAATFPGANGKIVISTAVLNPDGSGRTSIGPLYNPAWSPDGKKLAGMGPNTGLWIANADGSGAHQVVPPGFRTMFGLPSWSPDQTQVAYIKHDRTDVDFPFDLLRVINVDGTGDRGFFGRGVTTVNTVHWSADGAWLGVTNRGTVTSADGGFWLVRPDDSERVDSEGGGDMWSWSADTSRVLRGFSVGWGAGIGLVSQHPDGSDPQPLDPVWKNRQLESAAFSPDGTKIVVSACVATGTDPCPNWDLFVADWDGSDPVNITNTPGDNSERSRVDWQAIPINSYVRSKGATPLEVALVPAYTPCSAPNRTHGPPLAFQSCRPPIQTSDEVTVGTPDSNARPTKSRGLVRYEVIVGNPATPADEADVRIAIELFDVYEQSPLADYAGELSAKTTLRITDKLNTPTPSGPGAATVSDTPLRATVQCVPTADTGEGATCNLVTTADALAPGTVREGKRAVWALGQVQIDDGGFDNNAETLGNNTLFMTQGLFVP